MTSGREFIELFGIGTRVKEFFVCFAFHAVCRDILIRGILFSRSRNVFELSVGMEFKFPFVFVLFALVNFWRLERRISPSGDLINRFRNDMNSN